MQNARGTRARMDIGRSATPPAPARLRDLARQYVQAAAQETAIEIKRRLGSHAFALAQLAEQIERGTQMAALVTAANVEPTRACFSSVSTIASDG